MDSTTILATGGVSSGVIVAVGIIYKICLYLKNKHLHSSCVADLDMNVTTSESNDKKETV